ncbi:hypothetical protein LQW54_012456, partial [Pestalotiopsis sp. IQ-011]
MSLAIVERLERLDLAAGPAHQLRGAVKAAIETNFVIFPLLSAELRAKIIEAYLDGSFVQRGQKVQFLSGDGGDSFTQLVVTASGVIALRLAPVRSRVDDIVPPHHMFHLRLECRHLHLLENASLQIPG